MPLIAGGDMRAFELIFDRHASAALSLAYRICGRSAVAEDVVQETFLALWRSSSRYDSARGSVRSWVLSIVHNRAIDALRRAPITQRHSSSDDGIAERIPAAELTDMEVVSREEARQVRRALEQLPAEQRQVIQLAYFDGLTHRQIAQLLGVPTGTVKGRMRLGLHKLRVFLASTLAPTAAQIPPMSRDRGRRPLLLPVRDRRSQTDADYGVRMR